MRSLGVYLVEVELGRLKYANLPPGDILFTFRIGRNYTSLSLPVQQQQSPQLSGSLQLNVDASALEAQRCSLTLNTATNKRVLGIALVNLPRDKNIVSNSYKLTQSEDKQAEIEIKIRISQLDHASSIKQTGSLKLNSIREPQDTNPERAPEETTTDKVDTKPENGSNNSSNIRVKSKKSEEETDKKGLKNYKMMEDRVLEVTEKELKAYKQEKEAYYQMYQIEKSKNEVAARFISNLIKKITEKHPELIQIIQPTSTQTLLVPTPDIKKKNSDYPKNRQADAATIAQLEQANRSLHRQVEDYKKVVEQLREQISRGDNKNSVASRNGNLAFEAVVNSTRLSYRQKNNNIIPASLKQNQPAENKDLTQALAGVDLKKWLEASIGQREDLQARLSHSGPPPEPQVHQVQKTELLRKLKVGIERAFVHLLGSKQLTRSTLLLHKQEVNKILEECACT